MKYCLTISALMVLSAAWFAGAACSRAWPSIATANGALTHSVQAKFVNEPIFAGIRVNADAAHNQVLLTGSVPTEQTRNEAVELAKAATSSPVVINDIDVRPSGEQYSSIQIAPIQVVSIPVEYDTQEKAKALRQRIGSSLDDAWVYTRVEAKLVRREAAPALKINVEVQDNVVTLSGKVKSIEMKQDAERIARETLGVKYVRNLLQVQV